MNPETPGRKKDAPVPSTQIDGKLTKKLVREARALEVQNLTATAVTPAKNMMQIFKKSIEASSETEAPDIVMKMIKGNQGCALQNLLVNVVAATRNLLGKQPELDDDMRSLIRQMLNESTGLLDSFVNEISRNKEISKLAGLEQELKKKKIVKDEIEKSVSGGDVMLTASKYPLTKLRNPTAD